MPSAYYELYLKQVFDLAGTLVIKSEGTALAINEHLRLLGVSVDGNDPLTWKYYLNLAGEYHSTDKPMSITSIDTLETIPFTKAALREHRGTQKEYTYRSRYYRELLARYPSQELLIRGVLNPVDIQKAVSADDHTILYFDQSLVEDNEANLIPELQDYIEAYFHRWDVPDYRLTDPWFVPAQLGVLYAQIPKVIGNIRLKNCKTDFAHSYHIKQYLTSVGQLGPYFDFMTPKQRLFFYRNIRYINSNNAKRETYNLLTEKIFTDRMFPFSRYTLQQNDSVIPDKLKPDVELQRYTVNDLEEVIGLDIKTVDEVLTMEAPLALGNLTHQPEVEQLIETKTQNSRTAVLETRVHESAVLDLTEAEPFTVTEVLLNHWIYFSNIGRYRSVFSVNNPETNSLMSVSVRDAWLLYLYAYNKARGVVLDKIPSFDVKRVIRIPGPTRAELLSMVDSKYVPAELVDAALGLYKAPEIYASIEGFREACTQLHANMILQRDLAVYQHHWLSRGQTELMVDRFYMDYTVENDITGTSYIGWMRDNNYRIDELDTEELDILSLELFQGATGQKAKTTKTLKEIHEAMCKLMGHLSSYTLQVIPTINSGSLKIIDWSYLRYGDYLGSSSDHQRVSIPSVLPLETTSEFRNTVYRRLGERFFGGYENIPHHSGMIELKLVSSRGARSTAHRVVAVPQAKHHIFDDAVVDLSNTFTGQSIVYASSRFANDALMKLDAVRTFYHLVSEQTDVVISPSHVDIVSKTPNANGTLTIELETLNDTGSYFANRYTGKGSVVLQRLDLVSLGVLVVHHPLPASSRDLIADIPGVDVDDIVIEVVDSTNYVLKASPESMRWKGSTTLVIMS